MGTRGPVGKRSDAKHGHRSAADNAVTKAAGAVSVDQPAASDGWHPVAALWYSSLADSGQAIFYEPSDWATAFLIAESMSRDLNPQFVGFRQVAVNETEAQFETIPLKGASLSAYLKAMTDLLTTEGARRRASLELQRAQEDSGAAENVIDWYAAISARN